LRISDVALFHKSRLLPTGEIRIRTTKAGTHVYTWVPEWLQERIRQRAETIGPHIFGKHTTTALDVIIDFYAAAKRIVMPCLAHRQHRYLDNRAEN
jgi:hypothetical protein